MKYNVLLPVFLAAVTCGGCGLVRAIGLAPGPERSLTIYVGGAKGDDSNSGKSWEKAVRTIQKGLDISKDGMTVIVADGIYSGEGNKNLDFKGKKVRMKSAAGPGECIIDSGKAGRGFFFHSGETEESILEGFTIRNGYFFIETPEGGGDEVDAFRFGGGILIMYSSPMIRNCVIEGNDYAGIHCVRGNPHIEECTLQWNMGNCGGGILLSGSNAIVENCRMMYNFANFGGAVHCMHGSKATIRNCFIADNHVSYMGAGISCIDSDPAISDCIITGNKAICSDSHSGGGIDCWNSSPTITRCIITNNVAGFYGLGGGVNCEQNSHAKIDACVLSGNRASQGCAISCTRSSSVSVKNCLITGNGEEHCIGAVTADDDSNLELVNCLVAMNAEGGVCCADRSSASLSNCTIIYNGAERGGGLFLYDSAMQVNNCIIWGNRAEKEGRQIYTSDEEAKMSLSYCCIADGENDVAGDGSVSKVKCMGKDPLIDEYPTPIFKLSLKGGSPCIDAGDNSLVPEWSKKDIDNNSRVLDGNGDGKAVVDMGAYEYCPAK